MIDMAPAPDPAVRGWTPQALAVLERSAAHYGGVEAWRGIRTIRLIPDRVSGALPWLKGAGRTFPIPAAFEVMPSEGVTRFVSYPDDRHVGIFEDGRVRIERIHDGRVVSEAATHRESFRGLAKYRRWAPLDALYFFGYALTHYHSLPFSLVDARLVAATAAGGQGQGLDSLEVDLPAGLHTHCRRQTFYFDATGQIVRHDYHAEIVGWWARGAHFWRRQVPVNGFPIAMERHVTLRLGRTAWPPVALHVTFRGAEVELF